MTDLAFTRSEFERMVYASTNGGEFSLKYIYDTIFNLIQSDCKYKLTCNDYSTESVTLIIDSNCNRYNCVTMSVWHEDDSIGNIYVNIIDIKLMLPFSENRNKGPFEVNYIFEHCGKMSNNTIPNSISLLRRCNVNCYFEQECIFYFDSLFTSIANKINELFDVYGTHDKTSNENKQSLNIQDATMQALKALNEDNDTIENCTNSDATLSETEGD